MKIGFIAREIWGAILRGLVSGGFAAGIFWFMTGIRQTYAAF